MNKLKERNPCTNDKIAIDSNLNVCVKSGDEETEVKYPLIKESDSVYRYDVDIILSPSGAPMHIENSTTLNNGKNSQLKEANNLNGRKEDDTTKDVTMQEGQSNGSNNETGGSGNK